MPCSPQVTLRTFPRGAREAPAGPRVPSGRGSRVTAPALGGRRPGERRAGAASRSSLGLGGRSPTLGKRSERRGASSGNFSPSSFSTLFPEQGARSLAGPASRLGPPPPTKRRPWRGPGGPAAGCFRDAIVPRNFAGRIPPPLGPEVGGSWRSSPTHRVWESPLPVLQRSCPLRCATPV